MENPTIGVAIPAHPARVRNGMLDRALRSVWAQTRIPDEVHVAIDIEREGAPATRQRALSAVTADLVAFVDSDDELLPQHLERLSAFMAEQEADFVYSWFEGSNGFDPFPQHFGRPFDPMDPVETTITTLVRTDLAKAARFEQLTDRLHNTGEDWRFLNKCIEMGAKIVHLPERTWRWNLHGGNTSGLPYKGDAAL